VSLAVHARTSAAPTEPTREVRAGIVAMLPIVIGLVPFALALGTAIAEHSAPAAGWAGILPIFGGSAHLAVIQVVDQGAGAPLAIATGLLVHARLAVFSASLADRWRTQPGWFRAVGAALIIDPTWALADARAARPATTAEDRHFYLAAGITLATGWLVTVTSGMVLGDRLGPDIGLDVAVPLCLIGLAAPRVAEAADWAVVAAAAAVAAVAAGLPAGTGLVLAIAAGALAGRAVDLGSK
jgi:predicted branched-subunit amino acid permease